jgi:hypothetical protein
MGLEIPQACSIASELYIHFYFLHPPPYDEALRILRAERPCRHICRSFLLKGLHYPR